MPERGERVKERLGCIINAHTHLRLLIKNIQIQQLKSGAEIMTTAASIKYINYSSVTFDLSNDFTGGDRALGEDSYSQLPSNTLPMAGGLTEMALDENALRHIAAGGAWFSLGWKDPTTDNHFGVKIKLPLQVIGAGDRPYYETAYHVGSSGGDPDWKKPVDNPAEPYTFPSDAGFKIVVSPVSEHTSLNLTVSISNLN